ncbi:putative lipoprotein [Chlamydia pneumoniae LPCoLN]|nr:putative lipoprotein [Chlamydia pneumoniae LPCoLN]
MCGKLFPLGFGLSLGCNSPNLNTFRFFKFSPEDSSGDNSLNFRCFLL